ncbi:MAG: AAA family ATPase, partial [Clostridia bacterium]|nr:AAA family ATPase [Clostridia bacterium]
MKIINKLLYFLKIKIKVIFFKHDLKLLRKRLRIYEEILIDKKIHDVAYLIKDSVKYENIYTTYQSLIIMISNHNKRIKDLTDSFLEIINNNDIEFIIKTIDDYSIEKLQEFNEVALEIGKYTIPNSFPHKKLFIQNIIAIGRLINEYDDIKEQFTLLKSFNDVSILGDRYIDDEEASNIIHYLRSTLDKLHVFQKRYYSIPILEEKFIERHNEEFIKNNINNELFDNINGKSLDIEQRKAILYDTKSNLTIAGAGAGKTLTICGKVKWLLEHQKVDINNILLLSYSRASAEDLDVKVSSIQEGLKVKTFHSLGLEILNKVKGVKNTIDDQFKAHINKYFEEELIKDKIAAFSVFQFYTLYLYDSFNEEKQYDDEGQLFEALKKQDYTTLKDKLAIHKDSIEKHETMKN